MRFLLLFITVSSVYATSVFGYLKETEMSFCMDECAQYYIEMEVDPGFGSINVILGNLNIDVDMYINRFVKVELGEEIWCIECSAYQIDSIELSDECQYPVDCWVDPCEVANECQLNTPVDCVSNYCGSCSADFYDLEGNLVDCYSNECIDLSDLFFGWCDMYLGVGYSNGSCQYMSGCGWEINGVDYSDAFFESIEECENICNADVDINPGDFNNDENINILDVIILVNHILSPAAVELEGADLNNDGIVNILDVIVLINIILT